MDQAIISLVSEFDGYGIALYTLVVCLASGLLSGLIGIERELKGQPAGLRTHVLVSIGCSLLMIISIYAIKLAIKDTEFSTLNYDAARIAAGILSGIGFMGAGSIVKNGVNIKGLTTAATIWLSAALGMACGCGFILEAVIVTLVSLFLLFALTLLERKLDKMSPHVIIITDSSKILIPDIKEMAEKMSLYVKNISYRSVFDNDGVKRNEIIVCFAHGTEDYPIMSFLENVAKMDGVFQAKPTKLKGREDF